MTLNCRPGDLALIERAGRETQHLVGHFVTVKRIHHASSPRLPGWVYEPRFIAADGVAVEWLEDCCLRPIRDPGDDAVDESKAWLPPVPLPTIEPHLLEVGK